MVISVCLATYNGSDFIKDQLKSILLQIPENAEIVISDNNSNDDTISIIKSFKDSRIKLIQCSEKSIIKNFENALYFCKGDIIFLSDQDDIWLSNKVSVFTNALKTNDIVVSDCIITDTNLKKIHDSFYSKNKSSPGILQNILKNSYIGCCMAFNRKILDKALPIPPNTPMHDWWIGLIGEIYGNSIFIKDKTLLYRRHNKNSSSSAEMSQFRFHSKVFFRIMMLLNIFKRVTHEWVHK